MRKLNEHCQLEKGKPKESKRKQPIKSERNAVGKQAKEKQKEGNNKSANGKPKESNQRKTQRKPKPGKGHLAG